MDEKDILEDLGLNTLPEEAQEKLLQKMTESIMKRVTVEVLERLSEENREKFDEIREKENAEEIDSFLRSKIDDYDAMLARIAEEFKSEMRASIERLQN